jgi:hypothetical protein
MILVLFIALLFVVGAFRILSGWFLPAHADQALWRGISGLAGLITKLFVVAVGVGIVAPIIAVARA